MKIAITWDYELFFGERSGSIENCMLLPTNKLLKLAEIHNVPFTFFPDIGCIIKLQEFDLFKDSLIKIYDQIKLWDEQGHETGLHIHPHWERSKWINDQWIHDLDYYKLMDFSTKEANDIIVKYHNSIESLVQSKVKSNRAGGWCIQPFELWKKSFESCGIKIDSSVFNGGENFTHPYLYNFKNAPNRNSWRFSTDVLKINENGPFTEIPIDARMYSPWFFWKLFILGRLNPKDHKPIGDGLPASGGGSKWKLLSQKNKFCLGADGFFASKLQETLNVKEKNNEPYMVVIGHPKAMTNYSLSLLEKFILENKTNHNFVTLSELL